MEKEIIMLKLSLFVVALTAVAPLAEASALPKPMNALLQSELKNFASRSPQRSLEAIAPNSCADFSGQWAGTCQVKGQEIKGAFTVTQKDCSSISIDGDKIEIGHLKTETDSSPAGSANALVSTRFVDNGQAARATVNFYVDSPFLPDSVSGRMAGEMRKAGDDLQLNGKADIWLGMKDVASLPVECNFKKVN